ncbi:hypothetical protein CCM_08597 [Cordyceps militaris CM01]|uniref:Uncharacterized protein n=1 Tax=Cordyceps militaris (strain CM01) TaxID=983644 RepID=G3JRV9_CORMM|nr:uncharacterized protein CCM_08597 [Cordyceps militaris CM01]EGX88552.1 hypothetical protein CCM_08597 [Cordyceps militaris CM01]
MADANVLAPVLSCRFGNLAVYANPLRQMKVSLLLQRGARRMCIPPAGATFPMPTRLTQLGRLA